MGGVILVPFHHKLSCFGESKKRHGEGHQTFSNNIDKFRQ